MKLTESRLRLPNRREISLYGSSGNDALDQAAVNMLHEVGRELDFKYILDKVESVEGTVPGSNYSKRPLGKVVVEEYDGQLDDCRIQRVNIRLPLGVSEHPHPEGEFYHIPIDGSGGVLLLGDDTSREVYLLIGDAFYHISPGIGHAIYPLTSSLDGSGAMNVDVFKFSPELIRDFGEAHCLKTNLPE
ncbi:MAG: hypothetical protein ABIH52_03280 [Candidatus Aenigmatarchaeota archaeon]